MNEFDFSIFIYDSVLIFMHNSSNCFSGMVFGASVNRQEASFTLGNAITSRMLSAFTKSITSLSRPYARPACGGTPYLNASKRNPKRS